MFKRKRPPRRTGLRSLDAPEHGRWPGPRPRGIIWTSALFLLLFAVLFAAAIGVFFLRSDWLTAFTAWSEGAELGRDLQTPLMLVIFSLLFALPFVLHAWLRDGRSPVALGLGEGFQLLPLWAALCFLLTIPLIGLSAPSLAGFGYGLAVGAAATPIFMLQGGSEEVVCRGWMMQTVGARYGAIAALTFSSIVFSLLHLNPLDTPLGMIVSVLARVPLAIALGLLALHYGNLWGAIGAHAGWNAGMLAAAGAQSKPGSSTWSVLLDLDTDTSWKDLLEPGFAATLALMFALLAIVWFVARRTRAVMASPPLPAHAVVEDAV